MIPPIPVNIVRKIIKQTLNSPLVAMTSRWHLSQYPVAIILKSQYEILGYMCLYGQKLANIVLRWLVVLSVYEDMLQVKRN